MSVVDSHQQGCPAILDALVDICLTPHQSAHNRYMPILSGHVQGRKTVIVGMVDIGPARHS
jgi:hypothetical protein